MSSDIPTDGGVDTAAVDSPSRPQAVTRRTRPIAIAAPALGDEERARVDAVVRSGQLAHGTEVEAFESEFAEFCGVDHAVATSNGTTALHAALVALGVGPGSRVVTTPFSFVASANAAALCGAEVGFVDIDPLTYNLDVDALEAALRAGEQVDAVVAVHLFGLPADVAHLQELADEFDFALVEDAAQAHGAAVDGQRVGSFGDVACFSFYPTKNMTTGEGGMITTDSAELTEAAGRFIDHGRVSGYEHATVGHNYRLTDLAAAIGRVQLTRLPGFNDRRRENAARYDDLLADTPLVTPMEPDGFRHVYHQYTVRSADRDGLAAHLAAEEIGTGVYYPIPIHRQRPYAGLDVRAPIAERAADEVLSLPVHPGVSPVDVERVADAIHAYVEANR
ncbi:dTDP-4-amino-4,6-dideoxygalactose transaminase [Halogranum gelatinilyticum]|uniref:dTDP-4-amino-4,6-dideoxygalactose transaminase n=1 Tax=Halogranum gelatinilyticum TaxID=660521 RepID=A0A1G9USH8_9EURY|nr:DegT/DnrJ/EryC1/StrS family aminotransferase [Halogranum gelatinilyticum]SDM62852.1 dTDP-4-amino-4,6-dideoxygalactose transaminase [Halogranum gelatinilyticum]